MNKIEIKIKQSKFIYYIYNYFFSFLLNVIGLFVKTDNKLILFNAYGGKKYEDSPKVIYEYMITLKKYQNYKMIWAFNNPEKYKNLAIKCVKNNSVKFFITALKAKYWITNSSMERGLKFKKKNTFYINTWHSSALKKVGIDQKNNFCKFRVSQDYIMYAQSQLDIKTYSNAFVKSKESFVLCGLPRNDELCKVSKKEIDSIRKKIGVPNEKKLFCMLQLLGNMIMIKMVVL